jgi:hypothetical protein
LGHFFHEKSFVLVRIIFLRSKCEGNSPIKEMLPCKILKNVLEIPNRWILFRQFWCIYHNIANVGVRSCLATQKKTKKIKYVTTSTRDFLRKNPSNFAIARDLQNENMKYIYMAYIL